jgi:hypothetical protein
VARATFLFRSASSHLVADGTAIHVHVAARDFLQQQDFISRVERQQRAEEEEKSKRRQEEKNVISIISLLLPFRLSPF